MYSIAYPRMRERKDNPVFEVGCRRLDVGSVALVVEKPRSGRESRDCVDRMMIW
jgi:hypothetical protein